MRLLLLLPLPEGRFSQVVEVLQVFGGQAGWVLTARELKNLLNLLSEN